MFSFIFFTLGSIIGSFLNVCIYRLPKNLSLVAPRSFCPSCKKTVAFYDNIPLISYILLAGKCRHCFNKISLRYPVVELTAGIITAVMAFRWQGQWIWMAACILACYFLIAMTFIDLELFIIPNELSLGLAGLGVLFSFANPNLSGAAASKIFQSLSGAAAGFLMMWIIAAAGEKIFKKEAMGGGDLKLMAGIGAVLGWEGAVSSFMLATAFGAVYGITLKILKKADMGDPIPFGPWLGAGALINIFRFVPLSDYLF